MQNRRASNALRLLSVMLPALLAAGCYTQLKTKIISDEPASDFFVVEDLIMVTDQDTYRLPRGEESVEIWAWLDNDGDVTYPLSGCPEPPSVVAEVWDGFHWKDDVSIGLTCWGISAPKTIEFPPGGSLEFGMRLRHPGLYRLCLYVGEDRYRPEAFAYSNEFTVR